MEVYFIYVSPSLPPFFFFKLVYHHLWSGAEEGMVSSVCRSSESWFWTKQELQVSATKGSCILLSWAVGWHTLLLSLVWAVIQQPWHTGVMFLRVQNQQELWASLYKCNCSGLSSPAEFPASLASESCSCWSGNQVHISFPCFKCCLKLCMISAVLTCFNPPVFAARVGRRT